LFGFNCNFPILLIPKYATGGGRLFKELVDVGVAAMGNDMNEPTVFGSGTFPVDIRHYYDGFHGPIARRIIFMGCKC